VIEALSDHPNSQRPLLKAERATADPFGNARGMIGGELKMPWAEPDIVWWAPGLAAARRVPAMAKKQNANIPPENDAQLPRHEFHSQDGRQFECVSASLGKSLSS